MRIERPLISAVLLFASPSSGVDFNPPAQVRSIEDFHTSQTVEGWVLQEPLTRKDLEKQFKIQLYTLREDYQRQGRTYPEVDPQFVNVPRDFDQEHLPLLEMG